MFNKLNKAEHNFFLTRLVTSGQRINLITLAISYRILNVKCYHQSVLSQLFVHAHDSPAPTCKNQMLAVEGFKRFACMRPA